MIVASRTLKRYRRRLQRDWLLRLTWYSLPFALVGGLVSDRLGQSFLASVLWMLAAGVTLVILLGALWRARFPTTRRVARHLNRQFEALEDSAELLIEPPDQLSRVARAQRDRVAASLAIIDDQGALGTMSATPVRAAAASLLMCAAILNASWWLASRDRQPGVTGTVAPVAITRLQIDERPASYTGLAPLAHGEPSVDVHEFSELRWTLDTRGNAQSIELRFDDGQTVRLYAAGNDRWQSDWVAARSGNYQVVVDGEALRVGTSMGHRLVVVPDAAPEVRIVRPVDRTITLDEAADPNVAAAVVAADDFGLAELKVVATSAQGDGEQVVFEDREQSLTDRLDDEGQASVALDLKSLGAAPGRELYVVFEATDHRPEPANRTQSAALIVRWSVNETTPDIVIDNQVIAVEPEYFRSQRQIIIDSEALLEQSDTLAAQEFAARAQSLAFDERALRFRYGEFMGEEASGEPIAGADALGDSEHFVGDGHDHDEDEFGEPEVAFGDAMAAISPYAHFHDQEEQATLFDPETRALLGQALSAMWRAEGFLLQHDPAASLPHQYRALALIKRVQNRSRAYVNRVGVSVTPIDPERRLTGELDAVPDRRELSGAPSSTGDAGDAPVAAVLELLATGDIAAHAEVILAWAKAAAQGAEDVSAERDYRDLVAALMTWQADAQCVECRTDVQRIWRRVGPVPLAVPARRERREAWFEVPSGP